jgi:HEPN domain-containing protein
LWYTFFMNDQDKKNRLAKLKPVLIESLRKSLPQNDEAQGIISAVFDLIAQRASFVADDRSHLVGIHFLNEATRDVKSCKILFSKKQYPHAVYHLQQAVEKTIKGYVLLEGFYHADELKEISTHQSPLIIFKAIVLKTGLKNLAKNLEDKTMISRINNTESAIANEDKRLEVARTSQSEIAGLLSQLRSYRKTAELLEREVGNRLIESGWDPISKPSFQTVATLPAIMILAIITFPHWSYTRYPDGKMTPNDYSDKLGIVHETHTLTLILDQEIKNLAAAFKD